MKTRPLVVHTETIGNAAKAWLEERAEVVAAGAEDASFAVLASRIDALLVRTYTLVDEDLLDQLPNLKVVGRAGVGVDNIDVTACRRRGVEATMTTLFGPENTAKEHQAVTKLPRRR